MGLNLMCVQCGYQCDSSEEGLTAGDRCPECEKHDPVDMGILEEIGEEGE